MKASVLAVFISAIVLSSPISNWAATTNLTSQADVDIRSTTNSADIGYDRTVLVICNKNVDPTEDVDAKAYIRFRLPADFGAATNATFTLTRAIIGSAGWTYNVYGLNQGPIPGSTNWNELTWPETNTATPTTATTWNNAPGNDKTSATNVTSAAFLGTFVTVNAANGGVAGDHFSLSGTNLQNFLNADTNSYVTLIVSRSGVSTSFDQWASKENGTNPAPTLTLNYLTTSDPGVITWPTASLITNGQSLTSSILSGGASRWGANFIFVSTNTVPPPGTTPQLVVFTPTDTNHYPVTNYVNVTTVVISQGVATNLTSQADVDIRSTTNSADIGYDRTVLVICNKNVDPTGDVDAKAYIRFQLPADFGVATNATFTLTRAIIGSAGWTYNVYGLNQGPIPGSTNWNELTWPETNTATPTTATTWNNAPGNDKTSGTNVTSAAFLGTFMTVNAANGGVAGDHYSLSGTNLQNFLNTDTNGYVTLIVSRSGISTSFDQWASKENGTNPAPALTLNYFRPNDPGVITWPTASLITNGQSLASSTLSSGTSQWGGSFAFVNPSTIPQPGTIPQLVIFTPTDPNHYPIVGYVNVSTCITTNWIAEADVDIRSTTNSADKGFNRNVLLVTRGDNDPTIATDAKAYIRFMLPVDFASPLDATLTLTRFVVATNGFTNSYSVYGLDEGPIAGSTFNGLTWPEQDSTTGTNVTTWNNAPGNVTNSSDGIVYATSLGTFTTTSSNDGGQVGDQFSIGGTNLVNFLSRDTNNCVTLIMTKGDALVSPLNDQWVSKDNTSTNQKPTLSFTYIPDTNFNSIHLQSLASQRWQAWKESRTNYFSAAWQGLYLYTGTSKSNWYQTYHDARLNSVQSPIGDIGLAASLGIDTVIGGSENISGNLDSYISYSANASNRVTGYFLDQEMPPSRFPNLFEETTRIYRYDSNAIPLVVQLPNWAVSNDRFGLGKGDGSYYETYINKYVRDVTPCMMVADNYPIFFDGTDSTNFYPNIEYFRQLALTNNIGLMGFALVTSHTNGSIVYREPSESDLNWQVYAYMAYGADGMFYYNYLYAGTNYQEGLVNHTNDTPRATYYMVQNVDQELDTIWPVFKHLKSVNVTHTDATAPAGTTKFVPSSSSGAIQTFTATNFIIGDFINVDDSTDTNLYVMLVNKDHGAGYASSNLTRTVTFSCYTSRPYVSEIDPSSGAAVPLTNNTVTLTLGGGKGVLLVFSATTNSYKFPSKSLSSPPPPVDLSARLLNKSADGHSIYYVYARSTGTGDGSKYALQISSDLRSWTNVDYTEIGTAALGSGIELVTNRIPITGQSQLFIRVKIDND